MPSSTCQPALVGNDRCNENEDVKRIKQHLWSNVSLACWVALGVGVAGIYDFLQGQPPKGVVNLSPRLALAIFLIACVATALLAAFSNVVEPQHRDITRRALLLTSVVPALLADPTYSCLLIAVPLMDVRRRDTKGLRTVLTLGILLVVAVLLLTEDTPRITAEIEAMIVVGIAFMLITMLGDTFRQLDEGHATRTKLAQTNERMRLAEELHDSVGHHLLAASVQLQKATALHSRDPSGSSRSVGLAQHAISEALADTRLIVDSTRDQRGQFGFEASTRELVRRMSAGGPDVAVDMHGDHEELDQLTQLTLYRVVQEAFSNLVRHSAATRAKISSTITDSAATIIIADDGNGFVSSETLKSGGLYNMTSRIEDLHGKLTIDTSPQGTTITAVIPR